MIERAKSAYPTCRDLSDCNYDRRFSPIVETTTRARDCMVSNIGRPLEIIVVVSVISKSGGQWYYPGIIVIDRSIIVSATCAIACYGIWLSVVT